MRTLDDPSEDGGVHLGHCQAGVPEGEYLSEAARCQEVVAGRSGFCLCDDVASGVVPGGGHGGVEEPGADALAALRRMNAEVELGEVLLSAVEQAQEGGPGRD
jgi:hypothetical protein